MLLRINSTWVLILVLIFKNITNVVLLLLIKAKLKLLIKVSLFMHSRVHSLFIYSDSATQKTYNTADFKLVSHFRTPLAFWLEYYLNLGFGGKRDLQKMFLTQLKPFPTKKKIFWIPNQESGLPESRCRPFGFHRL